MKRLSPTQYACLDAMGIDVWVPRDELAAIESANEESAAAPVVNQRIETAVLPGSNTEKVTVGRVAATKLSPVSQPEPTSTVPVLDIPADWNGLQQAVSNCERCNLHSSRTQTVFGTGQQKADWLIIGDTPTVDDDKSGQPFSGLSGELLTAMLRAIKLSRQQVYITNTLKCTTPNSREPEILELETCLQYLDKQIFLLQPKLILVMGQSAAQRILKTHSTLARLRQKIHTLENSSIPVIVTYHPASLLSIPANKGKAWQDLLFARKILSTEAVL